MTSKRKPRILPAVDFNKVKTVSIKDRASKVRAADLAKPGRKGISFRSFEKGLPGVLAARDFRRLASDIAKAASGGKTVLWMTGAHVIKAGLSPVLIDLMENGAVTAIALNGAGAIHDCEMAMEGKTSEDVGRGLRDGSFGMARETGEFVAMALREGSDEGFGAAMGSAMDRMKPRNRRLSLLWAAHRMGIPVTVHVAIGTDIIHQQPYMSGDDIGHASYEDFRKLCSVVATLERGVVLNVGSAVILPEVFLKALTVARNLRYKVSKFTAANLDMIQHYRPNVNVVKRPTAMGGTPLTLTGHHELLVPLLAQAVLERL